MRSFENEKNIIFLKNNSYENWLREIENKYVNNMLLSNIANNAADTIQEKYTSETFNRKLEKILEI